MNFKVKIKTLAALIFSILLLLPAAGLANSNFFIPNTGYAANDILTSQKLVGYDVFGSSLVGWDTVTDTLNIYAKSGGVTTALGAPTGYYTPDTDRWNSFVRLDPSETSAWVGFTTSEHAGDDRIYQVDFATSTWTQRATSACNFDMEFYGENAYISGLNSTDWDNPNSIWMLDTSGANAHDLIIQMYSNSAGFAFDSSGNAYYAGYNGENSELNRWSAANIASAIGSTNLTYADATLLATLEAGAYDTDVDDADNVLFNGNGDYSYTAIWDGTESDDANYDYIGFGDPTMTYWNWFGFIDSEGDVTAVDGGHVYQADAAFYGIAEVNAVPVPAAVWLIGSAMLCILGIRRKN